MKITRQTHSVCSALEGQDSSWGRGHPTEPGLAEVPSWASRAHSGPVLSHTQQLRNVREGRWPQEPTFCSCLSLKAPVVPKLVWDPLPTPTPGDGIGRLWSQHLLPPSCSPPAAGQPCTAFEDKHPQHTGGQPNTHLFLVSQGYPQTLCMDARTLRPTNQVATSCLIQGLQPGSPSAWGTALAEWPGGAG